ncbi:MAG: helix-turn-helix domain-containing protein [Candidatus Acidiferrales bacterium]
MPRILHSRLDAANLLAISLRKLDQLIKARIIKVVKIGKRTLIPQAELESFASQNTGAQPDGKGARHGQ